MVVEVKDIEYLADSAAKKKDLTTGDVANVMQFSQQHVIRLCDSEGSGLKCWNVPDSKYRKIHVPGLVDFVVNKWKDLKSDYPLQSILRFFEVVGIDPSDYNIDRLVGRDGLRLYVGERLYTTGEAADLIWKSQQQTIRYVDKNNIEGYRLPNSKFRMVPSSTIVRYTIDKNIELSTGLGDVISQENINYPDPYLGISDSNPIWKDGVEIARDGEKSVWYREKDNYVEFSFRKGNNRGFYVKRPLDNKDDSKEESKDQGRRYALLLGKEARLEDGSPLPRKEHRHSLYKWLAGGYSLLVENSCAERSLIDEALVHLENTFKDISH